jgi:serine/threonine-protein kinase
MEMPEDSAQQCPEDLQRRQQHWDTLLAPHLRQKDPPKSPSLPPPSASVRVVPPPEQFIRTYYQAINQRQYTQTWAMLSTNFKKTHLCCDLEGKYKFNNYTGWWNTIEKVDVLVAKAHERNTLPVLVLGTLRYYKKNGSIIDETHLFSLIEDIANNSWLIEEQTRGTRGQK